MHLEGRRDGSSALHRTTMRLQRHSSADIPATPPLTVEDLIESGILWRINSMLHDYGIALGVDDEGEEIRFQILVAPDGIFTFPQELDDLKAEHFRNTIADLHDQAAGLVDAA